MLVESYLFEPINVQEIITKLAAIKRNILSTRDYRAMGFFIGHGLLLLDQHVDAS